MCWELQRTKNKVLFTTSNIEDQETNLINIQNTLKLAGLNGLCQHFVTVQVPDKKLVQRKIKNLAYNQGAVRPPRSDGSQLVKKLQLRHWLSTEHSVAMLHWNVLWHRVRVVPGCPGCRLNSLVRLFVSGHFRKIEEDVDSWSGEARNLVIRQMDLEVGNDCWTDGRGRAAQHRGKVRASQPAAVCLILGVPENFLFLMLLRSIDGPAQSEVHRGFLMLTKPIQYYKQVIQKRLWYCHRAPSTKPVGHEFESL